MLDLKDIIRKIKLGYLLRDKLDKQLGVLQDCLHQIRELDRCQYLQREHDHLQAHDKVLTSVSRRRLYRLEIMRLRINRAEG